MACPTVCRLCNRLIISTAVTFEDPNLIITIPAGSYNDGEKYCIVVAQSIPADTTITAPVFIQIGDGEQLYPLDRCDCSQATACNIRTRTRYSTRIVTDANTGTFRLLGRTCCAPNNDLTSINGTAPVTEATTTTTAVKGGK